MTDSAAHGSDVLSAVLTWLRTDSDVEPVDESWVPGTTPAERKSLAKLGGLTAALIAAPYLDGQQPAFRADDLRAWLRNGPTPPPPVVKSAQALLTTDHEVGLAALYAGVVSSRSRRTLGTFFTPSAEVTWMVNRWKELHQTPNSVVDVGAGVGIFTTAAIEAWSEAGVWSVDINPVTLGLLSLRVHSEFAVRQRGELRPGVHIELNDFTLWMKDEWNTIPGRRLLLGNPPYTRLQLLPPDERERLFAAAGGLCGRRASLSALITAQAINALGEDDGLCLLLPAQWLEASYAQPLREKLWSMAFRRMELRLFADGLFDDATVDAVALMLGPTETTLQPIMLSHSQDPAEHEIFERGECPAEFRSLFREATLGEAVPGPETGVTLGDLLEVRRGLATGANAFFAVNDENPWSKTLPDKVHTPLIRRLMPHSDVITIASLEALAPRDRYSLLLLPHELRRHCPEVDQYVATGEAKLLDRRFLCADRPVWHDVTYQVKRPDLIIGQSTQKNFRIVENQAHAAILNNLYGMSWRPHVSSADKAALLEWLRSPIGQRSLRKAARVQGSGLLKIEPKALTRLPLPEEFRVQVPRPVMS